MHFSEFSYTAVLDSDFILLWSDNDFIFKRMLMGNKKLIKGMKSIRRGITFTHRFKVDGVHYACKVERMADSFYICRATEEIEDKLFAYDEIFEDLDNIRFQSLNAITAAQMLESYLRQNDSVRAYKQLAVQRDEMMNIFSDSYNLLNIYGNNPNFTYVQLREHLLQTEDVINHAIEPLKKRTAFSFFIKSPVVKIDYKAFELALYNIVKPVTVCQALF